MRHTVCSLLALAYLSAPAYAQAPRLEITVPSGVHEEPSATVVANTSTEDAAPDHE